MACAISNWPGRCSKASDDLARVPPGEKKARRVGSFSVESGMEVVEGTESYRSMIAVFG
jgi:hypothetical protein